MFKGWSIKHEKGKISLAIAYLGLTGEKQLRCCIKEAYFPCLKTAGMNIFNWFCYVAVKYLRKTENAYNLPRHFRVFDNAHIPAFPGFIFYKETN